MKRYNRLIAIIISLLFIGLSLQMFSTVQSQNATPPAFVYHHDNNPIGLSDGGFSISNENINYKNVTLPNFNPWQLGTADYGRNEPQEPILANHLKFKNGTKIISGKGFVYQNTHNNLVAYMFNKEQCYVLSSKWQNLTFETEAYKFWASRQNIFYTQLNNGTLNSITNYGVYKGYFYVQAYFPMNNTYKISNTTLSVQDIGRYGYHNYYRSPPEWNIYPFSLNGTYLIDFSVGVQVPYGIFVWSIFGSSNGHMVAYDIGGIGLASESGQSSMTEYSFNAQIASQREITFGYFNWSKDKFVVTTRSMHDGHATTCNNQPYYITPLKNGSYKITLSQDLNDSATYWLWHFYYNPVSHNVSSVYVNAKGLHVDDMETSANQEVLVSNSGFITGITDSFSYIHGYYNLYAPFISYNDLTAYKSTNSWFNSIFNKTGNPLINVLTAGYNNSEMYAWVSNATHSDLSKHNGQFIIYSMKTYRVKFVANTSLPQINWILQLNNDSELHMINEKNYSLNLPNGTYSYTVKTVNNIYSPSPYSESFTVQGSNITTTVKLLRGYSAQFNETGLSPGTIWYVNLTNSTGTQVVNSGSIAGSSYYLNLTNGTYFYKISTQNNMYTLHLYLYSLIVNGKNVTESVIFYKTYRVTFEEKGLQKGIKWSVELNGTVKSSVTDIIYFTATNNTYKYNVLPLSGNSISNSSGEVTVNGKNLTINNIVFNNNTTTAKSITAIKTENDPVYFIIALIITTVTIISLAITVIVRHRK